MEGTPQGPGSSFRANIIRVKTFWEIGLHLVSDPSITYGGWIARERSKLVPHR